MRKILPFILCLFLFSCGGTDIENCPHLTHENGEKVNVIIYETKTEVIINYSLHSLEHLNTEGMQPCRYRVSWIGDDGSNHINLIEDKDITQ